MKRAWWLILGCITIAALSFGAGYLVHQQMRSDQRGAAIAQPTAIDLASVRLPDVDGTVRSLAQWRDKALLINFWATWCQPCREEIPVLQALRNSQQLNGAEVIGIALDFQAPVAEFVRREKLTYPILVAEQNMTVADLFGVGTGLPVTVAVSRDGKIVARHIGALNADDALKLLKTAL
jgi:thiol-disulfide isomerase/thioredoxin